MAGERIEKRMQEENMTQQEREKGENPFAIGLAVVRNY
jgi:hypothetical protein